MIFRFRHLVLAFPIRVALFRIFCLNPKLIGFDLGLGRTLAPGEEVVIRVTWLGDFAKTEGTWGT